MDLLNLLELLELLLLKLLELIEFLLLLLLLGLQLWLETSPSRVSKTQPLRRMLLGNRQRFHRPNRSLPYENITDIIDILVLFDYYSTSIQVELMPIGT